MRTVWCSCVEVPLHAQRVSVWFSPPRVIVFLKNHSENWVHKDVTCCLQSIVGVVLIYSVIISQIFFKSTLLLNVEHQLKSNTKLDMTNTEGYILCRKNVNLPPAGAPAAVFWEKNAFCRQTWFCMKTKKLPSTTRVEFSVCNATLPWKQKQVRADFFRFIPTPPLCSVYKLGWQRFAGLTPMTYYERAN